jgi:PhnB protein
MQLNPCLFFSGSAEEALKFYRDALGGTVDIMRYKDAPPEAAAAPDWGDKVIYGTLTSPFGVVAAMDAPPDRTSKIGEVGITLAADRESDAYNAFMKLAVDGEVMMPYEKTFWAEKFGMVQDKYGILWMINYRLAPISSLAQS